MPPVESQNQPVWYVLNYIDSTSRNSASKTIETFNSVNETKLELFAPTYVTRDERQGEVRFRTVRLTFHYVFVKGKPGEVKQLCSQQNGFSFLIDRGSEKRYATVDDRDMAHFKTITRAYKNCLPYFPLNDIDLESGDLVEVVKGDFPGLVGYYIPVNKNKTGNILLRVYNNVGTIAFNVKASDVRVLEFSPLSKRANDQIDAFVPYLLEALRLFSKDEALPTLLAAKLSMFCGRMEVARLHNRKLDARLQILLYAANLIIGNAQGAKQAWEKFLKVKASVTNEWTLGLINLITAVVNKDLALLTESRNHLLTLDPSSKAKQMLMKEYEAYTTD